MVNTKELSMLLMEASELSNKANWTKQDERRNAYLLSAISAVKSGASLAEIEQRNLNEYEVKNGLDVTRFNRDDMPAERRETAAAWQHFVHTPKAERRDVGGNPISRIGTYTGLGQFVPTEFFNNVFSQLKKHDPLFDEDSCTVINATNGRITTVPTVGDIENVASVVGEAGSQTETDISVPGQAVLGVYAYKTPRWTCSMEAFQDMSETITAIKLFTDFASSRLRRGIGADLLTGNGTGKTLGLITALENLASVTTPFITASGSANNTGGSETGATSIGSADISNLYYSVDAAYRTSDKCAFLMADSTLNYIDGLVTKLGQKLDLVKYIDGEPFILGKPVKISPSVPAIGASNVSVIFGDLSYWATKIVTGISANGTPLGYVQTYQEAPGLVENGLIGFRAFLRAGGVLAVNDQNSPSPLNYIRNHS